MGNFEEAKREFSREMDRTRTQLKEEWARASGSAQARAKELAESPRPPKPFRRLDDEPIAANPEISWLEARLATNAAGRGTKAVGVGCFAATLLAGGLVAITGHLNDSGAPSWYGPVFVGLWIVFGLAFRRATSSELRQLDSELRALRADEESWMAQASAWKKEWRRRVEALADRLRTKRLSNEHGGNAEARIDAVTDRSLNGQGLAKAAAPLALRPGERLLVECAGSIRGYRDAGFALQAGISGQVAMTGGSVSMMGDRVGVGASSMAGGFLGEMAGSLDRRESYDVLDMGTVSVTDRRVVFIGERRTDEIPLDSVVGAQGTGRVLELRWPQQRDGERYEVACADVIAEIILLLRTVAPARTQELQASELSRAPALAAPANGGSESVTGNSTSAPNRRVERDCPWCAEPILAKAKVCKHCGREVEPSTR